MTRSAAVLIALGNLVMVIGIGLVVPWLAVIVAGAFLTACGVLLIQVPPVHSSKGEA